MFLRITFIVNCLNNCLYIRFSIKICTDFLQNHLWFFLIMNIRRFIFLSSSIRRSIAVRFLFIFLNSVSWFILTINTWMELFFFPSMTFFAIHSLWTSCILYTFYIIIFSPEWTLNRFIMILFWISSIVLNIMSINTVGAVVISSNRTPNCFIGI